jgi:hypothetical protein
MSDRIFEICSRSIPRAQRHADGDAITDLAAEMATSGRSSVAREAFGIVRFGIRQRIRQPAGRVTELPWREALWMLAGPVTAVQFAVLLLAIPPQTVAAAADGGGYLGRWWTVVLAAAGAAFLAAVRRNRGLLGISSSTVLTLAVLDTWGPGGSMLGDTSHGVDLGSSDWLLSPAILFLMPVTVLPVLAAFARPPAAPQVSPRLRLLGLVATAAAPLFALVMTYERATGDGRLPGSFLRFSFGELGYLNFVVLALGIGLVLTMLARGVRRPAAVLSAALLVATQIPLLSLLTMFATVERAFFVHGFLPGIAFALLTLAATAVAIAGLLLAIVLARFRGTDGPTSPGRTQPPLP